MSETHKGGQLVFGLNNPPRADSLKVQITALGKTVSQSQLEQLLRQVNQIFETKNTIYQQEIKALVDELLGRPQKAWKLVSLKTTLGSNVVPAATVVLEEPTGKKVVAEALGDSSTDAIFLAIQKATNVRLFLSDFTYKTISPGENAMGQAKITAEFHGREVVASACSLDIIEAAAKAYLIAASMIKEKLQQRY